MGRIIKTVIILYVGRINRYAFRLSNFRVVYGVFVLTIKKLSIPV